MQLYNHNNRDKRKTRPIVLKFRCSFNYNRQHGNKPTDSLHYLQTGVAHCELTHRGREKMADISLTKFSKAFSWMKIYKFRLLFLWSLFLRVKLTIFQHWFRQGLAPTRRQFIIWTIGGKFNDAHMRHSVLLNKSGTIPVNWFSLQRPHFKLSSVIYGYYADVPLNCQIGYYQSHCQNHILFA